MKNKVLRLAIVAVLVVAMVLSMAACTKPVDPTPSPVVTPTPTKTPDKTPDKTPTPTKTPEVSTDEAKLQELYGITFPVAEGMKVDFVKDAATLKVVDAKGKAVKFGAVPPTYNDAFNAYEKAMTVTAKFSGLTAEGAKISIDDTKIDAPEDWATYTPTKAGTYTVVYTVKVAFTPEVDVSPAPTIPPDKYGYFVPAKVSETYTVTKTYEVAKKAITIESVSDAHEIKAGLSYPAANLKMGTLKLEQQAVVLGELKLAGEDKKFDLSIDIVSADLTAYGTYPLKLVCVDGKNQKVDVATLVAPDFEVTFKEGNRYVLTDAELAAAAAAQDDVNAASAATGAKKEDIELGVATYKALSEAAKTWFLQANNAGNVTKVEDMETNNKNLARMGLIAEAKALAKTWNDKLQNAEDGKKFVTYMLSLSTTGGATSDYNFVVTALTPSVPTASYLDEALAMIDTYKARLLADFAAKFNAAAKAADFKAAANTVTANLFDKALVEAFAKKVAAAQAAYDSLVAGQDATLGTAAGLAVDSSLAFATTLIDGTESIKANFARLSKFSEEMTARYAAYATLVDGLDAYTGAKVTKTNMANLLGYDFDTKKVKSSHADTDAGKAEASYVIFETYDVDAYVVFTTPMYFVDEATKSFKSLVDAYVALDAAIVSAQKDVITNLGSKIKFAVDDKIWVKTFDAATSKFVNADTTILATADGAKSRLKALQDYIAVSAIAAVNVDGEAPFAALAKKELSVVIAAALKDPVAVVNTYIKDETAFMFKVVSATITTPTITLEDFFAVDGALAAYDKVLTINLYKDGKGQAIPATAANITKNSITGLVFGEVAIDANDTIEVIYNGVTYAPVTVA